jgi:large subunit ribosomal protein L7e
LIYSRFIADLSLQAQKEKRGVIFKRAEKYVKEYRDQEREKIRLQRLAKQDGSFYIPAEEKLVFVIRIKGQAHL